MEKYIPFNREDIIIYRNNFYGDYTEGKQKKIYSANMLKIRGNPKLYGFTCENYPDNCFITSDNLQNNNKIEKILNLNIYYINKRLNAEQILKSMKMEKLLLNWESNIWL